MKDRRLLLVEDQPNDEKLILEALREAKISNVDVVRDGEEALNFLFCKGEFAQRDKKQPPAVVLLDLKLPKIDGLDVLKEMRANKATKRIPVVILTSSREEKDIRTAYDNGANSYIVKPIQRPEFEKTIELVGCYWLIFNEIGENNR